MKKLGLRNYDLISMSMNTLGFNDYTDGLMYEEKMYIHEIEEIIQFLKWLRNTNRLFGENNYEQRFAEFKNGEKSPTSWFEVHVHFPGKPPVKNVYFYSSHSHIKRISGDHTDKLQIAARLCSNLDDPDYIKVIEVNGTYKKDYGIVEMKKFVRKNQKEINKIKENGYNQFPQEFF